MKQILKREELIGKTIKSSGYGDDVLCVVFTDSSFCIVELGYSGPEMSGEEISLMPSGWSSSYLIDMGLISQGDWDKAIRNLEEEENKLKKAKEYEKYLILKAKFENS